MPMTNTYEDAAYDIHKDNDPGTVKIAEAKQTVLITFHHFKEKSVTKIVEFAKKIEKGYHNNLGLKTKAIGNSSRGNGLGMK